MADPDLQAIYTAFIIGAQSDTWGPMAPMASR